MNLAPQYLMERRRSSVPAPPYRRANDELHDVRARLDALEAELDRLCQEADLEPQWDD